MFVHRSEISMLAPHANKIRTWNSMGAYCTVHIRVVQNHIAPLKLYACMYINVCIKRTYLLKLCNFHIIYELGVIMHSLS